MNLLLLGNSTDTGDETATERYKQSNIRKIKGIEEVSLENSIIIDHLDQRESALLSEEEVVDNSRHNELMEYLDSIE